MSGPMLVWHMQVRRESETRGRGEIERNKKQRSTVEMVGKKKNRRVFHYAWEAPAMSTTTVDAGAPEAGAAGVRENARLVLALLALSAWSASESGPTRAD